MSKNKHEKKQKKKQKQILQVQEEKITYDVVNLIHAEQIDTKPNLAKFLNSYVEHISVSIGCGKIDLYPIQQYSIAKAFVKFLDGHELIYIANVIPGHQQYFLYNGLDEVELSQRDITSIEAFFKLLFQFNFIH